MARQTSTCFPNTGFSKELVKFSIGLSCNLFCRDVTSILGLQVMTAQSKEIYLERGASKPIAILCALSVSIKNPWIRRNNKLKLENWCIVKV